MVWEIVWSIVLGVIIGSLVSALSLFFIEKWKLRIEKNRWLASIFMEINENKNKKFTELKLIYDEIENTDHLSEIDFIEEYKCDYTVYYKIINNGVHFSKNILIKYARFINVEEQSSRSLKDYFSNYLSFKSGDRNNPKDKELRIKFRCLIRTHSLPILIRKHYESQLIRIHELYEMVKKDLIKSKIFKESEITDASKETRMLFISYLGETEEREI